MDKFPDPVKWVNYYHDKSALHVACYNKDCPNDVIRFLVEKYPAVLEHVFLVEDEMNNDNASSLPLHYFLSRNKSVDINTVKMMVEIYPRSLMIAREGEEEYIVYPILSLVYNEHITPKDMLEIITFFHDAEPASLRVLDGDNATVLHHVCYNKYVTLELVQFLYNSWPEAIRMRAGHTGLPIHDLCRNNKIDDTVALEILRFMLDVNPSLSREGEDYLPIHTAAGSMSFEFCKVLINAYPESLRVGTSDGSLPIHEVCNNGGRDDQINTIHYMLELDPESINAQDGYGDLPIHRAAMYGKSNVIELLLKHDPDAASKETKYQHHHQQLPLHIVCQQDKEYLDTVKVLYDAYPEAFHKLDGDWNTPYGQRAKPIDFAMRNRKTSIVNFLQDQKRYIGDSDTDIQHLTSRTELNDNGLTLLHRALKDKAPLGTIKLVIKGNPATVRTADNQFAFPLHIACWFSSVKVVQYLVGESNKYILGHLDENKNSILHYACHGGNLDVVKYLITNHSSLVAAEVNKKGKLPLHLLCCEVGKDKVDIDSAEYVETIWLMLLANPEALLGA